MLVAKATEAIEKMSEKINLNNSQDGSSKHVSVIDELENFWEENDAAYRD